MVIYCYDEAHCSHNYSYNEGHCLLLRLRITPLQCTNWLDVDTQKAWAPLCSCLYVLLCLLSQVITGQIPAMVVNQHQCSWFISLWCRCNYGIVSTVGPNMQSTLPRLIFCFSVLTSVGLEPSSTVSTSHNNSSLPWSLDMFPLR